MQVALAYRSNVIARAQEAAQRMEPLALKSLATRKDIERYVHDLLSREEQEACDQATD